VIGRPSQEIRVFSGPGELARGGAEEFLRRGRKAIDRRGRFAVALSGGSTPSLLFQCLAEEAEVGRRHRFPWGKVHCFWGDERMVPANHPDSNYRAAREAFLDRLPIPAAQIHPVPTAAGDASEAARQYEARLVDFFKLAEGQWPGFDLIFLGLGVDGHTASLFPGTAAVSEERRLVIAPWVDKLRSHRVTLTFPVINRAGCVIFLVSGKGKAEILKTVLEGEFRPDQFPAQAVRPATGSLLWFLDRPAAGSLNRETDPGLTRKSQGGKQS
jgi:6-phosphogluconolactonase